MKSRVLFVGCGEKGADELRSERSVSSARWEALHVGSASEALQRLESGGFDFVVSRSRVGDVAGSDLLDAVRERYPHTVRMLVAPGGRGDASFDRADAVHQVLPTAFGEVEFDDAADRALRLRDLVADPGLARLVREVRKLPSLPSLYRRITEEMRRDEPSLRRVGELVASDPAMTAKILQVVNSPAFGTRHPISDPVQAVTFLGLDTLEGLVLSVKIFEELGESALACFPFRQLREHSDRVAHHARRIARLEGAPRRVADVATTAGLLHDIGRLVLASRLGTTYANAHELAAQNGIPLHLLERETFGAGHAEVGAFLVGLWGLDGAILEAVLRHHGGGASAASDREIEGGTGEPRGAAGHFGAELDAALAASSLSRGADRGMFSLAVAGFVRIADAIDVGVECANAGAGAGADDRAFDDESAFESLFEAMTARGLEGKLGDWVDACAEDAGDD